MNGEGRRPFKKSVVPQLPNFLQRLAKPPLSRFQPVLEKVQSRAQERQEQWMRRRQIQWDTFRKAARNMRERAVGWMSDWVIVDGVIEKSTFEVRPSGASGWVVVEKGHTREPLGVFPKKNQAVNEGIRLARAHHAKLNVFNRQGKGKSEFVYGTT